MKVSYGIGNLERFIHKTVLSIGVFDGVHAGHRELIDRTVAAARKLHGQSVVMTFYPHPVEVLDPRRYVPLVATLPHRIHLIEELDVDHLIVIKFNKRFARLKPENFIKRYIVQPLDPLAIFVGCDFRFGNNRSGTLDIFKSAAEKHGFQLNVVHSIERGREKISSTRIRHLVREGKLKKAAVLLGRRFSIMGIVEKGESQGTHLGFPTANLYPQNEILPPRGVYAIYVTVARKRYPGMANVGWKPTFHKAEKRVNVEAHIFNFKQNLVGKNIIIEFVKKIRNEKEFDSPEKLVQQLRKDEKRVRAIL